MAGRFGVIVLALSIIACSGETEGFVGRDALVSDDASRVRFPGAFELANVGAERATTLDGEQPAFHGHILGTDAEAEEVRAYYATELEGLGWLRESTTTRSSDELAAWWWCKEDRSYRLAIKDQPRAYRPEFYQGREFRTVFDATLISRDPELDCPDRPSPLPTRP